MKDDINIHPIYSHDGKELQPLASAMMGTIEDSCIVADIAQSIIDHQETVAKMTKIKYPKTKEGVFNLMIPSLSDLISIIGPMLFKLVLTVDKIEGNEIQKKLYEEKRFESIVNSDIFKKAIQEEVSHQMYKVVEACNKTYGDKVHVEIDKNESKNYFSIDLNFSLINDLSFQDFFKVRNVTLNDFLDKISLCGKCKVRHISICTLFEDTSGIVRIMHRLLTSTISFSESELMKPVSHPCRILRYPVTERTFDKYIINLILIDLNDDNATFIADLADEKKIDD